MTTRGPLLYTWRGSATSSPVEVGRLALGCWHGPRRCGRRTTPIVHNDHYLGCVPPSDRWLPSSLRCRRRRSSPTNYLEARPSARRHQQATLHSRGCPAPCSIKGVEVAWRSGRLLTPANRDLLRGPTPFSSVWKSNFGRPTPSTRGCLHSCVCSMALRLTKWPNSLFDFHTGSRAMREIRPGDLSIIGINKYHLPKTTGAAVASKPGPERGPSSTEATVREASGPRPTEARPPLRGVRHGRP